MLVCQWYVTSTLTAYYSFVTRSIGFYELNAVNSDTGGGGCDPPWQSDPTRLISLGIVARRDNNKHKLSLINHINVDNGYLKNL